MKKTRTDWLLRGPIGLLVIYLVYGLAIILVYGLSQQHTQQFQSGCPDDRTGLNGLQCGMQFNAAEVEKVVFYSAPTWAKAVAGTENDYSYADISYVPVDVL